jgi:hypothetical protein
MGIVVDQKLPPGAPSSTVRGRVKTGATVILGASLVVAFALSSDREIVGAHGGGRVYSQDVVRKLVIPKGYADFLAVLKAVQSVHVRSTPESAVRVSVTLDAAGGKRLVNLFANEMPVAESICHKGPEHQIEFHLKADQYMIARVHDSVHAKKGTIVEFVVASRRFRQASSELADILRPYIQRLSRGFARRLRGRVALQKFAATLDAETVTALELEDIHARDLTLLRGMSKLRALDVSRSTLTGNALHQLAHRDQLHALSLSARQVGAGDWLRHFRSLDTLRVTRADLKPGLEVQGHQCAGCHEPAPRTKMELPASGAFAGLVATRRVRHLEVTGVTLDPAFCKIIGTLPFLETIDLSGCDLDELDFAIFGRLPALRRLNLDRCVGVEATELEGLRGLRKLNTLYLRALDPDAAKRLAATLSGRDVRY